MPDYNIYIHANLGKNKKTDPEDFENSNTTPLAEEEQGQKLLSLINKGNQLMGVGKAALGAIKGVAPVIAVLAAAKVTDKVITTVEPFISQATGDYRFNVGYNNLKAVANAMVHPASTIMARLHANLDYEIAARRNEQQRILLGDSIINNYGEYKL